MKILITSIFILTSLFACGQEIDCSRFKNGKFILFQNDSDKTIIERHGEAQIEYGETSKLRLELKVKWLDECTYTLKLKKVLENPNNYELPENMILTVEIIETKKGSYIQKTFSNIDDMVIEDEMFLLD